MFEFDVLKVFDTDKVNDGVWLHLINPANESPMYLDEARTKPCRVKVRSVHSRAFDEHLDTVQRRAADRVRSAKGRKATDQMLEQLKKERPESFGSLVAGFENVSAKNPGEINPPRSDLMAFAKVLENRWVVDQVLEYAAEDANYASQPPSSSGNADAVSDAAP